MPVKSEIESFHLDNFVNYDSTTDEDVYDLTSTDPLLSDDIWKKFDLDFSFAELPGIESILSDDEAWCFDSITSTGPFNPDVEQLCEIRNHDCMWAGHCGSKEHPADAPFNNNKTIVTAAPGPVKTPVPTTKQPVAAGRSLLLKTVIKQASTSPLLPSPESPPISDDEEHKTQTNILKVLNEAIEECDIDEDSDLCEYFEEGEDLLTGDESEDVKEEEVKDVKPPPPPCKPQFTPEIDHSYHKGKLPHVHIAGLGIETPSDSEEEIDVVSVGEKQTILNNRLGYVLPNNPTFRDRQHLQRTMASAIQSKEGSEKMRNTFVKPCTENSPIKRHLPESRAVKRNKINHYRITPNSSPYKRRLGYGHSSDSEPEPSEKRSLHNNMERQRRIDLRNAFEDLRLLVPEVCNRERAPKVVILREAASYCDHLGNVSLNMYKQLDELRKQQERLRARVSQLRRSLAAKR